MGFFVSLGIVLVAPIVGILGLASFSFGPLTTLAFLAMLAIASLLAVRFHSKHHRSEAYDDHLTDNRMDEARESLINLWKRGDEKE